ncbi:MAG: ribosome silencing factor [Actinobacteria bacterium]|nr:ribosome silencing factor [Actinomycetota bacterium]NIS31490.1 ribosome silencing factor [Actinomycetota bacterium]NIT95723.1 ribosome silencing factor [Actinomycetota bacterium]NIU19409.1 ribosome silencing factor [Actinomycetota bacterium]NIU66608.1 ribosome silencing factor [Actinomycetota bacterium]
MNQPDDDHLRWVREAALAADDKLATDTIIIDVGEVFAVSDHFVVTSGSNPRQVRAIVDEIEQRVRAAGGPSPVRVEGAEDREWVLMDYGPFVVHVFLQAQRDFYRLEQLWGDRPRVEWQPATRDREIS